MPWKLYAALYFVSSESAYRHYHVQYHEAFFVSWSAVKRIDATVWQEVFDQVIWICQFVDVCTKQKLRITNLGI
jgi:hypothetical protein